MLQGKPVIIWLKCRRFNKQFLYTSVSAESKTVENKTLLNWSSYILLTPNFAFLFLFAVTPF